MLIDVAQTMQQTQPKMSNSASTFDRIACLRARFTMAHTALTKIEKWKTAPTRSHHRFVQSWPKTVPEPSGARTPFHSGVT